MIRAAATALALLLLPTWSQALTVDFAGLGGTELHYGRVPHEWYEYKADFEIQDAIFRVEYAWIGVDESLHWNSTGYFSVFLPGGEPFTFETVDVATPSRLDIGFIFADGTGWQFEYRGQEGDWSLQTLAFNLSGVREVTFAGWGYAIFDNFTLHHPEPATALLLALGVSVWRRISSSAAGDD